MLAGDPGILRGGRPDEQRQLGVRGEVPVLDDSRRDDLEVRVSPEQAPIERDLTIAELAGRGRGEADDSRARWEGVQHRLEDVAP
jgi:hypothetical protein